MRSSQHLINNNVRRELSLSSVSSLRSQAGQIPRLPPITQPLISKYRVQKLKQNLLSSSLFQVSIFQDFFCVKHSEQSVSMCTKCQRSSFRSLCSFITTMIQQQYDWKNDPRFQASYQSYHRKKINVFLSDQEIQFRLVAKFTTLGVVLLDNHKILLIRIIRNYIKHTIYYGQHKKLTLQNDLYFWFVIGVPKYFNDLQSLNKDSIGIHEPLMFWMLQIVMKKLNDCTRQNLRRNSDLTLDYCRYFYAKQCKCLDDYGINLKQIFYQWMNQAMMGYMGIQFIGFFIKSILKEGFDYVQKTIMSYFEKKVIKMNNQQIISLHHQMPFQNGALIDLQQDRVTKKQIIMKCLLDNNQEWPGIFFNTSVFVLL